MGEVRICRGASEPRGRKEHISRGLPVPKSLRPAMDAGRGRGSMAAGPKPPLRCRSGLTRSQIPNLRATKGSHRWAQPQPAASMVASRRGRPEARAEGVEDGGADVAAASRAQRRSADRGTAGSRRRRPNRVGTDREPPWGTAAGADHPHHQQAGEARGSHRRWRPPPLSAQIWRRRGRRAGERRTAPSPPS